MLGVSVWDLIIVDLLCWLFLGICLFVFFVCCFLGFVFFVFCFFFFSIVFLKVMGMVFCCLFRWDFCIKLLLTNFFIHKRKR